MSRELTQLLNKLQEVWYHLFILALVSALAIPDGMLYLMLCLLLDSSLDSTDVINVRDTVRELKLEFKCLANICRHGGSGGAFLGA